MTTKEYVYGLRQLADWYERHPNVKIPHNPPTVYSYNSKEEALFLAGILGRSEKKFEYSGFYLIKKFGELELRFCFNREVICERVVTGTRIVPAVSYPEHPEDIIEWKCHPLLEEDATKTQA